MQLGQFVKAKSQPTAWRSRGSACRPCGVTNNQSFATNHRPGKTEPDLSVLRRGFLARLPSVTPPLSHREADYSHLMEARACGQCFEMLGLGCWPAAWQGWWLLAAGRFRLIVRQRVLGVSFVQPVPWSPMDLPGLSSGRTWSLKVRMWKLSTQKGEFAASRTASRRGSHKGGLDLNVQLGPDGSSPSRG
jgi:hypothetical protein